MNSLSFRRARSARPTGFVRPLFHVLALALGLLLIDMPPGGARAFAADAPQSQTTMPQLEYLKALNAAAPVEDPQLIFLLMSQFVNAARTEEGVAYFTQLAERYQPCLAPPRHSLYLAALALLRASHTGKVPLLQRVGWVTETVAIVERARAQSGDRIFIVRWVSGVVYANLPGAFGKAGAARADLLWCSDHAAEAPSPGFLREVYFQLAVLSRGNDGAAADAFLKRSGYTTYEKSTVLTTPFTTSAATGHRFAAPRLQVIAPGRVFALSGFEFTEYYFVVSKDGKQLIGIDAGTHQEAAEEAFRHLRENVPGLPPLTTIFVTHAHWDHIGGHGYFRKLNPKLKIYARENYGAELRRAMGAPLRSRNYFFGSRFDRSHIQDFKADATVNARTAVDVGGTRFDLIPIAGGETDDALFVFLPEESVLFAGDFVMPYFGAPFLEEGNIPGLFDAIDQVSKLAPKTILHGHQPLTAIFGSVSTLEQVKTQLQWLHGAVLDEIAKGSDRAEIHQLNLTPPTINATPAAQLPYLLTRRNFIDRLYHQNTGYWKTNLEGLDHLSRKELGSVYSYYLGLTDAQLAAAVERMVQAGDHELAGTVVNQALAQFPDSAPLLRVKSLAFAKLRERFQEYDPFRFIVYSQEVGQETLPVK